MKTTNRQPLVSVLMNCYNGEEFLHEAINSVLAQTYQNWELIFWDNCSTDDSLDIVKGYRNNQIKCYSSETHTTLGVARAAAWKKITGEFVAILDCDDLWFPKKIEQQLKSFEDSTVSVSVSNALLRSHKKEESLYADRMGKDWSTGALIRNYSIILPTVVLRREAIDSLSIAFNPQFSNIADFDLVVRASMVGRVDYIPETLAVWRVHRRSLTWQSRDQFVGEKVAWIEHHLGRGCFRHVETQMQKYYRDVEVSRSLLFLEKNQAAKARKINLRRWRADRRFIILIILSFVPGVHLLLTCRKKWKRARWFGA